MSGGSAVGRALRTWLFRGVLLAIVVPAIVLAVVRASGRLGRETPAWIGYAVVLGALAAAPGGAAELAARFTPSWRRDAAFAGASFLVGLAGALVALAHGHYFLAIAASGPGLGALSVAIGHLARERPAFVGVATPLAVSVTTATVVALRGVKPLVATLAVSAVSGAAVLLAAFSVGGSDELTFGLVTLAYAVALHPLGLLAARFDRALVSRLGLDADDEPPSAAAAP